MASWVRDDKELVALILYDLEVLELCRLFVPLTDLHYCLIRDEEGDVDVLDIGHSDESLVKDFQIVLYLLLVVIWMARSV